MDLRAGELRKSGLKIKLQEQPFQVLAMLLQHPGKVVTREELQKVVWPADTFVDFDRGLNKAINKIREALGDEADNPRFVETLPRRGYRFIVPVDVGTGSEPSPGPANAEPPSPTGTGAGAPSVGPAPQGGDQGVAVAERSPEVEVARELVLRGRWGRWALALGGLTLATVTIAILAYELTRPLPPPRVSRYIQITNDAQGKVWYPWFSGLAADGSRVYFMEGHGLAQVSAEGGETVRIQPFPRDPYAWLFDISPNRTELLVGGRGIDEDTLWILTVPGGTPRRVGDVQAHAGTWFPDGQRVLYANSHYLYSARPDGAESRTFLSVAGSVVWPRWSPDGSRVRFTVYDPSSNSTSLWEASADGRNVHPWLRGWNERSQECCGNWTPDGKYFVFQSARDGRTDIWARREKGAFLREPSHEPIRLTAGPIETSLPVPSPDGKRLYVVGVQRRGEIVRYDPRSRQFGPYLSRISAEHLDFSRDGQWVTYVAYPEATLWRSKVDDTERLQLTSSPMRAAEPVWSPDGKWIAFMASEPGTVWKIFLVSVDGGMPQRLMPGERSEANPGWSPDGAHLVFGRIPWLEGGTAGIATIHVLDLKTKQVSTISGSEGLMSPRWSPDGRYIAAVTYRPNWTQALFDFTTQKWTELTKATGYYNRWSRDGKYVYFHGTSEPSAIFRVRVSDRTLERVVALGDMRRAQGVFGDWNGLAPDDSVLVTRDVGIQEIYALDVDWP